jgi:hypothetical protein
MAAEQKTGQPVANPRLMDRRSAIKSSLIYAERAGGVAMAAFGIFDLFLNRQRAIVNIVLKAKEKSPQATDQELKREIHNDIGKEGSKSVFDAVLMAGGAKAAFELDETAVKTDRDTIPNPQSSVETQPELQK